MTLPLICPDLFYPVCARFTTKNKEVPSINIRLRPEIFVVGVCNIQPVTVSPAMYIARLLVIPQLRPG